MFTVSKGVAFDTTAFRNALMTLFTDVADVSLVVSAASVSVEARLIYADEVAGNAAVSQITSTSNADFSSTLGVTVEGTSAPVVTGELSPSLRLLWWLMLLLS